MNGLDMWVPGNPLKPRESNTLAVEAGETGTRLVASAKPEMHFYPP